MRTKDSKTTEEKMLESVKKLLMIVSISVLVISCGPSACDCEDILTTVVNSGFKKGQAMYLSDGPIAAKEYQSKVSACTKKFTELNRDTKKMDLGPALKYMEDQTRSALRVARAKCN